jgi:hypothetical protein
MERRPPRGRGPRPRRGEPRRAEAPLEPQPAALVADLARRLVPDATGLRVDERTEHGTRVLTVHVESGNVGALIGRRGRTGRRRPSGPSWGPARRSMA